MKKLIKKIIGFLFELLTLKKNVIVFESNPDLSDNTYYVFKELLNKGYNSKYKFVWFLYSSNKNDHPQYKNVKYINANKTFNRLFYKHKAKAMIFCNRYLENVNNKQVTFFLQHGEQIKNVSFYYEGMPTSINYGISTSPEMAARDDKLYKQPQGKFVPIGFARNDELVGPKIDLHPLFPNREFDKVIAWYPTVRQNKHKDDDNSVTHPISFIWDIETAKEINSFAKERKVLLVVKVHPAQKDLFSDISNLSNIAFIDDSYLKEYGLVSYSFLRSTEALLTDYSSIYYDYMVTDKPIGFVWDDIEEFKKNIGFVVEDEILEGGEKIYQIDEFKKFILDISLSKDNNQKQRRKIRDRMITYIDNQNSSRVSEFIISKISK